MVPGVKRIEILGIPIDVVSDDALPEAIESFYEMTDNREIVLLSFHEMMKARHNSERRKALSRAALVIPVSRSIVGAARFLKKEVPPYRGTYPFIIKLLVILESRARSAYLLGSNSRNVIQAESAVRATFPGLQIVGRHAAVFSGNRETDVITAIKKSSPTLLLAGRGLKGRHLWLSRNRESFAPGLSIYEESCYEVFAGRKSKPDDRAGARLFRGFFSTLIRPWRLLRIFRYLLFYILLLFARIRG